MSATISRSTVGTMGWAQRGSTCAGHWVPVRTTMGSNLTASSRNWRRRNKARCRHLRLTCMWLLRGTSSRGRKTTAAATPLCLIMGAPSAPPTLCRTAGASASATLCFRLARPWPLTMSSGFAALPSTKMPPLPSSWALTSRPAPLRWRCARLRQCFAWWTKRQSPSRVLGASLSFTLPCVCKSTRNCGPLRCPPASLTPSSSAWRRSTYVTAWPRTPMIGPGSWMRSLAPRMM
mmetsp:Transcript_106812/g.302065  ORF Transcript_106812/g.302065 Transcript_106812/m.302065 type:complete len:234 (+) Transcript_106812:56-757(+)